MPQKAQDKPSEKSDEPADPGWYPLAGGGYTYYDGTRWTGDVVPPVLEVARPLGFMDTTAAVMLGVWLGTFLMWGTVRLGADSAPDIFFWPIKVVVDPSSLP